jgi:hypothetical protein
LNTTLKIRFFGNGFIYRSATFSIEWWEKLLLKNRMKQDVFLDNLFTDDLFLQKTIIHPTTGLSCCNYREMLGKPLIKGASVKEHGFLEIKQNNKHIYKGNIQTICLDNVLFPLFNSDTKPIIDKPKEGITISAGIFTKGLVGYYTLNIDEFRNDNLEFQLINMDNEKTTGTFVNNIIYKGVPLIPQASDYLISSQRYWCEIK